ncbi:MAG: metallophosphoesterase [Roseomonas sp.]|nr:metallophosphoesterase [Roseomonas sp.]
MPPTPLSRAELVKTVRAYDKAGHNKARAALALGIGHNAMHNRLRRAREAGLQVRPGSGHKDGGAKRLPEMSLEDRVRYKTLESKNRELARLLAEADAKAAQADKFRALSAELHDSPQPPPKWTVRVPAGKDAPGVPVLMLSDWHIGETVDSAQVHGCNEFNAAVADRRVKSVIDRVLHLSFHHAPNPQYPGIVVVLGGDFVSGWLHEELFRTDWCAPTQATNWCVSRLHAALLRLAEAFGKVHAVCVPGNHGRLTKKPMAKGGATSCFDHAIYEALSDRLRDDARITWQIPASGDALFQVAGTRFLAMHGHELGVKGGDGLIGALGPIMRGAIKTGRAERSLGRDFDVLLLGHFHQSIWQPHSGLVVNGTLKGFDEYSRMQRYSFAPPTQSLFFVHPRFGPNLPFNVFCDEPKQREQVRFVAVA